MSDNQKEEIGNLLTAKEYYIKRLDMICELPNSLDKIFMSITSTCIAIFGGLGVALVALHNDGLSNTISLILSIIVPIIGIYASSILLSLSLNTNKGHVRAQKELDVLLKILNKKESFEMIKLQNAVITDTKNVFNDNLTKSQACDLLVNVIKLIRWLMIIYLAYTVVASVLSMLCQKIFEVIW
ncbi:MAG: hypothetical protein HGA95_00110 [Caldiserica bacterium]|nr:hypothetical protein [Caldisericota bacterium]